VLSPSSEILLALAPSPHARPLHTLQVHVPEFECMCACGERERERESVCVCVCACVRVCARARNMKARHAVSVQRGCLPSQLQPKPNRAARACSSPSRSQVCVCFSPPPPLTRTRAHTAEARAPNISGSTESPPVES
jgi:hypothetical protein